MNEFNPAMTVIERISICCRYWGGAPGYAYWDTAFISRRTVQEALDDDEIQQIESGTTMDSKTLKVIEDEVQVIIYRKNKKNQKLGTIYELNKLDLRTFLTRLSELENEESNFNKLISKLSSEPESSEKWKIIDTVE